MPKEETFPIPRKYIDVPRSTHTDLDVLQEKKIDDNWNVDSSKHLSDSWREFTKFILPKEKSPKGYLWSGWEIDKDSNDYQIMYGQKFGRKWVMPLRIEKKKEWAKEKPKLDNARKMRGIYFIDPDDTGYVEILKNARRKLESPMAPAKVRKRMDRQHPGIVKANAEPKIGNEKEFETVHGCIVESNQSTRQKAESLQSKAQEDRIAEKGFTSMTHNNFVHKFIPMPQAMKLPDAKVAVDKEWKKTRDNSSLELGKSQEQKGGGSSWRRKETMKVHFAPLMGICHLKNAELEPKLQKYKRRVVLW